MRAGCRLLHLSQSERLTDSTKRFLIILRFLFGNDRQVVEQAPIGQEGRVETDAFLAAERRGIDERSGQARALRNPDLLLLAGRLELGIGLPDGLQPGIGRLLQVPRFRLYDAELDAVAEDDFSIEFSVAVLGDRLD